MDSRHVIYFDTFCVLAGLRVNYAVSELELLKSNDDVVLHGIRDTLVNRLQEMASTYAVELDRIDVHFNRVERAPFIEFTAKWMPETDAIEIKGGELDGTIYAHEGAPWKELKIRQHDMKFDEVGKIVPRDLLFHMLAWDDRRRVWIYGEK